MGSGGHSNEPKPPRGQAPQQADARLGDARRLADAEDRIADAEREIADAEVTIADLGHQVEGDPSEGSASEADQGGVPGWRAARDESRAAHAQRAGERSDTETEHTRIALDRFELAEERDRAANSRDCASAARDVAAEARDRRPPPLALAPAVAARRRAAADRGHSAGDRAHSSNDRTETKADRMALRDALAEAHTDALTGTNQRAIGMIALQGELDRAARAHRSLTLAFVDVDNLKVCNDRHGHAAGDALLRDVAASITANLRSYDPIVRYGGDEFICALADADLPAARRRFQAVSASLNERNHGASISVGFAVYTPGESLDELISRGDADLYRAKRQRRAATDRTWRRS